mmetsp:Transcript_5417/g.16142  ORF Transcript_5417/g.16142 Transcript_5417/m.16142 type:complete len:200 (-) Transcript_5417:851-1450(-)
MQPAPLQGGGSRCYLWGCMRVALGLADVPLPVQGGQQQLARRARLSREGARGPVQLRRRGFVSRRGEGVDAAPAKRVERPERARRQQREPPDQRHRRVLRQGGAAAALAADRSRVRRLAPRGVGHLHTLRVRDPRRPSQEPGERHGRPVRLLLGGRRRARQDGLQVVGAGRDGPRGERGREGRQGAGAREHEDRDGARG